MSQSSFVVNSIPDPQELEEAVLNGDRINMEKVVDYMRRLTSGLVAELQRRIPNTTPVDGTIYIAPHGNIYKLYINDSGGINILQLHDSGWVTGEPGGTSGGGP